MTQKRALLMLIISSLIVVIGVLSLSKILKQHSISDETSAATTSADKNDIAFHSNRDGYFQLYITNADGSNQHKLTETKTNDVAPIWSPDGKYIAFHSYPIEQPAKSGLYVMDADGTHRRLLANSVFTDPVWSPDSQRIAFVIGELGKHEIHTIDYDGSNELNIGAAQADNNFPTWSADSKHFGFISNRTGNFEIFVSDTDSAEIHQLTNHANVYGEEGIAWSPDGEFIAFIATRGNSQELAIIKSDGSNLRVLANSVVIGGPPVWSPDSQHIAYQAAKERGSPIRAWQIYTVDMDSTQLHHVSGPYSEGPSWSSDSQFIAFMQNDGTGDDIYVASIDGTYRKRLTNTQGILNGNPAWSK